MEDYEHNEDTEDEGEEIAMEAIKALSYNLLQKRNIAVEFRAASGVEQMWREDDAAFDGSVPGNYTGPYQTTHRPMMEYVSGTAQAPKVANSPQRSQVVVNIIRGKCETAEGRFSDILLPTDDKNWGLKETPVPDISKALKDKRPAGRSGAPVTDKAGNQLKMSDIAKMDLDKIKAKMSLMEDKINDQLIEADYNASMRKLIQDAIRTGTGIIKGPNVVKKTKKAWLPQQDGQNTIQVLEVHEEHNPVSEVVKAEDVYPDPDVGEDIKKAAYIWESGEMTPRELRDLYGVEGYIDSQILLVLKEEPKRFSIGMDKYNKYKFRQTTTGVGELYERWTYYGDMGRDDLESMHVDIGDDEITQSFSVCAVFANERPIKVCLNTLDTGDMPYDFFQWTSVRDSPWGIGIPRMEAWLQKIMNGAWRAMMDNAGDSSGVNVVIGPQIEPMDGNYTLTGKKGWRFSGDGNEDDFDARKAFQQFQVLNNQAELQAIIELVLKFSDMETGIPMIFQGEQKEAPETLGATNIMVDANNVSLRGRVKRFDDQVTKPHLSRYYNWNMQYNENNDIKGDFNVDPRGTSVLLQKDQQAQTLTQVMGLKADPDGRRLVNWEKALKKLLSSLNLDILKTEDELAKYDEQMKQNPPQKDPKLATAELKVQGEMEKAKLNQKSDMDEITAKGQLTHAELAAKAEEADKERQHDMAMQQMELQVKMMEFASRENISIGQVKASLASEAIKSKTKLKSDSDKLKVQIALTNKNGEAPGGIAEPIIEPVGKASPNKSFIE